MLMLTTTIPQQRAGIFHSKVSDARFMTEMSESWHMEAVLSKFADHVTPSSSGQIPWGDEGKRGYEFFEVLFVRGIYGFLSC